MKLNNFSIDYFVSKEISLDVVLKIFDIQTQINFRFEVSYSLNEYNY